MKAMCASDGSGARDGVLLGIPLIFGLDEKIGLAGHENVRLDNFAKLRGHLRRLVEFVNFPLLRLLDIRRNNHARIQNRERNILAPAVP